MDVIKNAASIVAGRNADRKESVKKLQHHSRNLALCAPGSRNETIAQGSFSQWQMSRRVEEIHAVARPVNFFS
jgi:hypothetical protein